MFSTHYLIEQQRRQDMMRTAERERLARLCRRTTLPLAWAVVAWTGRRLVRAGEGLQRRAHAGFAAGEATTRLAV